MSVEAAPLTALRKRRARWAVASVVTLAVIAGVVASIVLLQPKASSTGALSSAVVARKTLSVIVSGTGSTVVADAVTVNPTVSGTVQKLYVSLGETVTAGQDLYTISSTDADAKLLQAKGSLLQSRQSVKQAKGQVQQASSQVYSAKTQLIQAEQNLSKLQSEPATAPGRANDITIAKRQVTSAKAGVSSAQTSVSSAEIGVLAAAANLSSAQNSYDDALAQTKDTVVTAPIDGVVTALPISVGSVVTAGTTTSSSSGSSGGSASGSSAGSSGGSSSGSTSSSGSSASGSVTISDMSSLKVQVSVSEVDIPSVARGQKATVTFDAIADKTFAGKVTSISPNGTTSSGVVNYDVDITLDTLDPSLKPNMTATVDIATKVASNVLVVPIAAVKTTNGVKYVDVVGPNGVVARKTVTTGVSDETYTEVKTGVAQGVYVSTGTTASGTTASRSSSSSGRGAAGGGFMTGGPGGAPPSSGPGGN